MSSRHEERPLKGGRWLGNAEVSERNRVVCLEHADAAEARGDSAAAARFREFAATPPRRPRPHPARRAAALPEPIHGAPAPLPLKGRRRNAMHRSETITEIAGALAAFGADGDQPAADQDRPGPDQGRRLLLLRLRRPRRRARARAPGARRPRADPDPGGHLPAREGRREDEPLPQLRRVHRLPAALAAGARRGDPAGLRQRDHLRAPLLAARGAEPRERDATTTGPAPAGPRGSGKPRPSGKTATEKQIAKIHAIAREAGISGEQLAAGARRDFGCESLAELLSTAQASELIDRLGKLPAKPPEPAGEEPPGMDAAAFRERHRDAERRALRGARMTRPASTAPASAYRNRGCRCAECRAAAAASSATYRSAPARAGTRCSSPADGGARAPAAPRRLGRHASARSRASPGLAPTTLRAIEKGRRRAPARRAPRGDRGGAARDHGGGRAGPRREGPAPARGDGRGRRRQAPRSRRRCATSARRSLRLQAAAPTSRGATGSASSPSTATSRARASCPPTCSRRWAREGLQPRQPALLAGGPGGRLERRHEDRSGSTC